jgi:hypothetical protein
MKPLLVFTGNVGFCAHLNFIIKAFDYSGENLFICCDFGVHGSLEDYFQFPKGVQFVHSQVPGYALQTDEFDVVHPDWDHPNPTLELFEKINSRIVSFERQSEIAKLFKPKMMINYPCEKYDAVHIRRGDALTAGEGTSYHHASEYIDKTTLDDVFVMSDDYNVLSEISKKVLYHLIPEDCVGNWTTPNYVTQPSTQPIFMFQSHETKRKLITRLVQEMYIAANSETFIHEVSNIPHFIKLIHKNPESCISLKQNN